MLHLVRGVQMAIRITVEVKPRAKNDTVEKLSARQYRVSVHAPPVDGKANEAVIKLLAQHFSVSKSSVRVLRGRTSRKKLVEID